MGSSLDVVKLFKVVLFQAVIASLYLGYLSNFSGELENSYPSLIAAIVFTVLYVAATKGWMTPVKKLVLALVILSRYWFSFGFLINLLLRVVRRV